ncbi:MAG: hypothetical protein JRN20_16765 [Nitrososphaerota archaeon]|nr:hypothetical protein [Nitrososphaerota archaeon]
MTRESALSKDGRELRYLSYAVSAPIVAAISFVALGLAESHSEIVQIAISLLFASVLPIVAIVYFARSGRTNLNIPNRRMRTKPFVAAIASYFVGSIALFIARAPSIMSGLMIAYTINTVIMLLVTRYWRKASIHACGIMGPVSFLTYQFGAHAALLYLLVLPVGLVRLKMKEHTFMEVAEGAVIGLVATWLQLLFLLRAL